MKDKINTVGITRGGSPWNASKCNDNVFDGVCKTRNWPVQCGIWVKGREGMWSGVDGPRFQIS